MQSKYINIETGEIVSKKQITKKDKKHLVECYVGIETKFPCDCTTEDQLLEALNSLDNYLNESVKVNTSCILKMVTEGLITVKECSILTYLCERVSGWNYYIGRMCDMDHIVTNSKNLTTLVKGLEDKRLIKVTHKGCFYKDSVVIRVNPFYAWKGNVALRNFEIQSWYGNGDCIN